MLRHATIFLLGCWCGLGLLHTGYVMVRPHGLIIRRAPELARTIGLPSPEDGRIVVAILELLDDAVGLPAGPVLVWRPAADAQPPWDYVHFQVAHQAYPRRVDVVGEGAVPPLAMGSYRAVIAPRGVAVALPWRPRVERAGLILYRLPVP